MSSPWSALKMHQIVGWDRAFPKRFTHQTTLIYSLQFSPLLTYGPNTKLPSRCGRSRYWSILLRMVPMGIKRTQYWEKPKPAPKKLRLFNAPSEHIIPHRQTLSSGLHIFPSCSEWIGLSAKPIGFVCLVWTFIECNRQCLKPILGCNWRG